MIDSLARLDPRVLIVGIGSSPCCSRWNRSLRSGACSFESPLDMFSSPADL
jgi:hypothetical protein